MDGVDERLLREVVKTEIALRKAQSVEELADLACTEIQAILSTHRAYFAIVENRRFQLLAISKMDQVNEESSLAIWMQRVMQFLKTHKPLREAYWVSAKDLDKGLAQEWDAKLVGQCAFWCPLISSEDEIIGGLFVECKTCCTQVQKDLTRLIADTCGDVVGLLKCREERAGVSRSKYFAKKAIPVFLLVVLVLLFIPISQTAMAPAEIVAKNPVVITAPFSGVVEAVSVKPHQLVRKGQLLLKLDSVELKSKVKQHEDRLHFAREKYHNGAQYALVSSGQHAQASLTVLRMEVEHLTAELSYVKEKLAKARVMTPKDGLVIFADSSAWVGRPVRAGEKILSISNSDQKELLVWLPVENSIHLKVGDKVNFYSKKNPLQKVSAQLTHVSYQPSMRPDGRRSYLLKAVLVPGDKKLPAIGTYGTAKIYGETASLAYYMLVKPVRLFKQWFGF